METDCVTCLVISGKFLFLVAHNSCLFLSTNYNLDCSLFDFIHSDSLFILPCGEQSCLVKEVFKVCTCKSCCCFSDGLEFNIRSKRLFASVYFKNSLSAVDIRIAYNYLSVKSARTHKSRIENIGSVSSGNKDNALVCTKTVHFYKQLVKSLLTLIVTATEACTSLTTYGVNLINKDNTR